MKAIIFGSSGQDGYYLTQLLQTKKIQVIGVSRKNADVIGNIEDKDLVSELIKTHQPDYIFHLAANSTTRHDALWDNHAAISTGTLIILEAVKRFSLHSKVFLSGSALQFKNEGKPIDESAELVATSPYGVSRNQSLYAGRYYRSLGLKVYFGYFFNHDSPMRPNRHMAQKIASYCQSISKQTEKLTIGAIDVKKEWTFAGDIVDAIWILVNQDKVYECILGSGKAYSIKDWIEICFNLINYDWNRYVVIEKGFVPEYDILVSDPKLLFSLGWLPKVDITELAKMMLQ
ncbi:MAG: GDP-mannose 4,6-dehydratase [Chitinophagales bacterium]